LKILLKVYNYKKKLLNISSMMRNKRRSTTRRRVMYGGQAPAPATRFPGQNFDPADIHRALNNYLLAAHSINEAAKAIHDTSLFQNNPSTGTRVLQKTSALSFSTAASSFLNSLRGVYGSLSSGEQIVIPNAPPL